MKSYAVFESREIHVGSTLNTAELVDASVHRSVVLYLPDKSPAKSITAYAGPTVNGPFLPIVTTEVKPGTAVDFSPYAAAAPYLKFAGDNSKKFTAHVSLKS